MTALIRAHAHAHTRTLKHTHTHTHTHVQTDRQADRQIDRQTDRQTDRQMDRQINRQAERQTDTPVHGTSHEHGRRLVTGLLCLLCCKERWGAGVETQKNVRGEIGGWGRVPFNETYALRPVVKYHLRRGVGLIKFLENGSRPQPPISRCKHRPLVYPQCA